MRVLGIDTATRRASVGLLRDGTLVAENFQTAQGNHAVSLLPLVDATLQAAGWTVRDLDAIAISNGPGSFSGLRVGLSVAKGLAYALGLPVVPIPTLEALARTVIERREAICTLLDARKGELYAACFQVVDGQLRRRRDESLCTRETLVASLPTPCAVLGDAVVTYGPWLRERLGDQVTLLPFETYGPRGGAVAAMGWERLQSAGGVDLASLEPFYIRTSDAERNAS